MKIHDISMTVNALMTVYKNKLEKKPQLDVVSDFSNHTAYETKISMNLHTGTHMDFPLHMIKDGKTSDALDLHQLIRKVKVLDLTHIKDTIDEKDLKCFDIKEKDFLLFKTKNSLMEDFDFQFVYLSENGAIYLKNLNVSGVGTDALGIERDQIGHPTHHHLLSQDIIIIEGLRLKDIQQGEYQMIALPIQISGVEALPLKVVLLEHFL